METKQDRSYGVIPVRKTEDGWNIFLINQYGSRSDVYWTFPKGHLEEGETPEESAQRELLEETGIMLDKLDTQHTYTQAYTFTHKDTNIEKTVLYYLGFVEESSFSIQEDEVKEAGWFALDDARKKLSYDQAKEMFDQVIADLA